MKTEEEKKEIARLRTKAWYNANKEKAAAYNKKYNSNPDNKARKAAIGKAYDKSRKDGLFTVYCLPEENYVGMTTCLQQRLTAHKSVNHNRNIEGAYVLGKYPTKREALDAEASFHAKGFKGSVGNNGFKKGHQLWRKRYE
tara:strand:- start:51 stop:473 length:423 start_codon:yes stop_codon:yes gene_type:complete